VVLDSRPLGLALPSPGLDPGPLRTTLVGDRIRTFGRRAEAEFAFASVPPFVPLMKRFLLLLLVAGILATGCSRSDKPETSVKPQSTPDAERLRADSIRLQQATENAVREREKAAASASPTPTVSP
jgi:hypothetical protein